MKIVIVNGRPTCGKTTFENFVREINGNAFTFILSAVDFVKAVAYECGWDGTKTPRNRKFLSDLKTLLTEWNDVPLKQIKVELKKIEDAFDRYDIDTSNVIVFIDLREPKEIKKFCKELGATSLLIRRADVENLPTSNYADDEVFNYEYDDIIENNGNLNDLKIKAAEFIEKAQSI